MSSPSPPFVNQISESFIKPFNVLEEMKKPFHLTPWDLAMLSTQYIQSGLLFIKPPHLELETFIQKLKQSLALTLDDYYPLAARFATKRVEDPPLYNIFVDCSHFDGVKFIHATLDNKVSDVISPTYTPAVLVHSLFDLHKMHNHDGHTIPLMSIQVTELIDGIFIGCSMNHAIADGTTFWNFFNKWSDIFQRDHGHGEEATHAFKSHPTVFDRWTLHSHHDSIVNLPFKNPEEFIRRYKSPLLKERIFHFTKNSIFKLKTKVNLQNNTTQISSFQSLSALLWRSITRTRTKTRNILPDVTTSCLLSANNRTRLNPPLSQGYFGNCLMTIKAVTTVGELLGHDIGWAGLKLHNVVINHDDKNAREWVENWMKSPLIYQLDRLVDPCCVMMGHSPRFNMYGNEFGLGKPIATRSGHANKTDGKITCCPGYEEGSIDLEICLYPDIMSALESDKEFMSFASEKLFHTLEATLDIAEMVPLTN